MQSKYPESIESITLEEMLPRVFEGDAPRPSEIWRRRVILRRGTLTVIAAESGTGKSSLCSYIYGSRRDFSGRILFDGIDTATVPVEGWQHLRRRSLAYLPQEMSLFPELTARQNIELKNSLTGHATRQRIDEWLERLGIASRAEFKVGRMSIGQQQRVGIIRALCQPFDFLLLDEPVSHLDADNNRIAAEIIMEEAARQGAGVIATSVGNHLMLDNPDVYNL